ncbi:MHC class II regulatory factor RFX1 isoform X1 [Syngnathus typhle]|uniref:MHC class II regulatory factor RFX1 isoform X1 n=2 Tax=Syngnathus typhle TaxID=161592 RepID=UPI002A6A7A4E|nr:MHC class II regulatory factor RFX1 isoform X1 [Syngnathus typhle]
MVQSTFSGRRGLGKRLATVAPVKARRHSHGSPGDENQATGVNNPNRWCLKGLVAMATSGYSEDLQPQQTNTVTIASTPASTTPSSTKAAAAHFLAGLPLTSGSIASANQSAKTGQDALSSQAPPTQAQSQKAAVLAAPTQHYISSEIQHTVAQKSNGQNTSPQYIIVTVTEGSAHSNDSLSESSSPALGVPTRVVQPVQTTTQRSVLQTVPQAGKRVQSGHVNNLQSAHINQEVEQVYSGQVQYVDGGGSDNAFTTSSIRPGGYSFSDSPLYSQTPPASSSNFYEATSSSESDISGSVTSQTLSSSVAAAAAASGGTSASGSGYVIQGAYLLGGGGGGQSYSSPNSRAPPATVQWLCDNYEGAEGVSLPRCTLYYHYLLHCQEQKLEPVNAASFGKLIRSVFMGLRTRRLGTRGNSKYHYYGLRIKSGSPLLRLMDEQQHMAMRQQPFSQKSRVKAVQKTEGIANGTSGGASQQQAGVVCDISAQVQQYQQFLEASRPLPDFVEMNVQESQESSLPDGILPEHLKAFQTLYREHCEAVLDVMVNLQFTLVETLWKSFWRFSQSSEPETLNLHHESEKRLPKSCLVLLCKFEPVLNWTRTCDNLLYQTLVEILIPDVLRPIPSALTQAIRNFAKSLESWLSGAMMNIPEEMVRIKVVCVSSFSQTLRRYTSLNHLAQAARAVLQNSAQINQMLSDLNRVDFTNVQEQASWVCQCEDQIVQRLEQDFKMTLQQQNSLEQWASWLDGVVSQVLKPYEANPVALPKAAKVFLLNWSFYSSMVIRDLTLRSAASFGSFHLIRLLYDEYMYYLIEHRVARAKGETPVAVMGEFASTVKNRSTPDLEKDEEDDDEDEESEDESADLVMQSSSLSMLEDKELLEPPAKQPRTTLSLHSLTETHNTPA